jgi:hypothetical protein
LGDLAHRLAQSLDDRRARAARYVLLFLALCGALAPRAASAEDKKPDEKEAARLFSAAQDASDKGDHLTAIRALEEAYRIRAHPYTLFSMAQAYRRQFLADHDPARARRALELYRQFIQELPSSPWRLTADKFRAELAGTLERIGQMHAESPAPSKAAIPPLPTQLMVTSRTPDARIFIDDEGSGEKAPAIRVVEPGDHRVRVEARGHRTETQVIRALRERLIVVEIHLGLLPGGIRILSNEDGARVFLDGQVVGTTPLEVGGIAAGEHSVAVSQRGRKLWTSTLWVQPEASAVAVASLAWSRQRRWALATLGGAGVLGLSGLVTGLVSLRESSLARSLPTSSNDERSVYDQKLVVRDKLAVATNLLFAAAGVVLGIAAGLYFFDVPDGPVAPRLPGVTTSAAATARPEAQGAGAPR